MPRVVWASILCMAFVECMAMLAFLIIKFEVFIGWSLSTTLARWPPVVDGDWVFEIRGCTSEWCT